MTTCQYPEAHQNPGSSLVEPVEGPVARLTEWGRQTASYPDGCPGGEWAHYSLYFKGHFIANTSTPGTAQAERLREIALLLNGGD